MTSASKIPNYARLLDKAKKLKALAERGIGEESKSAENFYQKFLADNGLTEAEVDSERLKRKFTLMNYYYEVLISHIIMSVNPFCEIKKEKNYYFVVLDDEDFVEVEYKTQYFYGLFNVDRKKYLDKTSRYKKNPQRELTIFMTAFVNHHKDHWQPDEYSIKKARSEQDKNLNPIMADKIGEVDDEDFNDKLERAKRDLEKNKKALDEWEAQQEMEQDKNSFEMDPQDSYNVQLYMSMFADAHYVRANRTITTNEVVKKKKKTNGQKLLGLLEKKRKK